jgi:hypothetical protein
MPYSVKWKLTRGGQVLESPTVFLVPAAAIDFACAQFDRALYDIWIEGPNGIRIERDAISRSCRDQGPPRAPSSPRPPSGGRG